MRHKYATTGIVLSRASAAEASVHVLVLTKDLGLIRARAQGVRKPGAKLAGALQTFAESDISVVHGKEGWRLSGAVLIRNWFQELPYAERERAGRIASLVLRLIQGQTHDPALFTIFSEYLNALTEEATEDERDARECLAALRILRALGLDAGDIPGGES
jgi:DNA repair protein RecO